MTSVHPGFLAVALGLLVMIAWLVIAACEHAFLTEERSLTNPNDQSEGL